MCALLFFVLLWLFILIIVYARSAFCFFCAIALYSVCVMYAWQRFMNIYLNFLRQIPIHLFRSQRPHFSFIFTPSSSFFFFSLFLPPRIFLHHVIYRCLLSWPYFNMTVYGFYSFYLFFLHHYHRIFPCLRVPVFV